MRTRLERKGWHPRHIDEAQSILDLSLVRKHPKVKKVENSMYWFTLILSILGTCLLSIAIIPILVVANDMWSYIITGSFGLLLGVLIAYISKRMHWLEQHHKVSIMTIAPIIGIFNFFLIATMVNKFVITTNINNYHNPVLMGLIYFVSFMMPHILMEDRK